MLLFYSNVSNFIQILPKSFLVGPNLVKAAGLPQGPVHSRVMLILPSGAKKNGKIVLDYFAVFLLFCLWFDYYFASVWKIDTTSLHVNVVVYFAQILKIFAWIMANFSALGCNRIPCIPMPYAYVPRCNSMLRFVRVDIGKCCTIALLDLMEHCYMDYGARSAHCIFAR